MQFYLGGKEVDLREVCGHTAGDSIVSVPAAHAVFVGDLVLRTWRSSRVVLQCV
jgi:glyoxylase-like metal-dependent hydrolase (beta-lactamase superfamily II)